MGFELYAIPTEVEISALISSLAQFPEHQGVARRMAFEIDRLKSEIDYWSYCTDNGMRKLCPEQAERLEKFMVSCKVQPWYKRGGET